MPIKKRIVLIDDDFTTNTLNKLIIERSKLVDEILTFERAEDALTFLQTEVKNPSTKSMILLDINMPLMNGWDFLNEYNKLNGKRMGQKIVMLTSSIDPSDKMKADESEPVLEFISKPLSMELVDSLVAKYLH